MLRIINIYYSGDLYRFYIEPPAELHRVERFPLGQSQSELLDFHEVPLHVREELFEKLNLNHG
jgi:hypothetical protein